MPDSGRRRRHGVGQRGGRGAAAGHAARKGPPLGRRPWGRAAARSARAEAESALAQAYDEMDGKPVSQDFEAGDPGNVVFGVETVEWDPSCEIVAGNLEELGVPFAKTVEGETAWFEIAGEKRVRRPRPDRRPVRACAGFRLRPHIELRRARRVRRARTGVRHGSRPANRQDRRSEPGPVARRRQRREPANRNPRDRGPTQDAASSPKSSKRAACPTPARLRAASRRSWSPAQARPPRRAR